MSLFKKIVFYMILLIIFFISSFSLYLVMSIPSVDELVSANSSAGTKIFDRNNRLIAELKKEPIDFIPVEKLPKDLINAVVAVEDSRFFQHNGVDLVSIVRALLSDVFHLSIKEGGSTITQQLSRTIYLSTKKTFLRKVSEILLSIKIETKLSKEKILELYLNNVYFGHGRYGIENASRLYFDKPASELTLPEAAMLAGIIKSPSNYSPLINFIAATNRQAVVLALMEKNGFLRRTDREAAELAPLSISPETKSDPSSYFMQVIRAYLLNKYGYQKVYKEGLNVYTTIDLNVQTIAWRTLREGLTEIDKETGWHSVNKKIDILDKKIGLNTNKSLPFHKGDILPAVVLHSTKDKSFVSVRGIVGLIDKADAQWIKKIFIRDTGKTVYLDNLNMQFILKPGDVIQVKIKDTTKGRLHLYLVQKPLIQGVIIAIEQSTGHVLALQGGYDFEESEFNRAMSAKRQPGSVFKPIIYALALEQGYKRSSMLLDQPISINLGNGKVYSPENYDKQFRGMVTMDDALKFSINTAAVRLAQELTVENIVSFSKKMGIQSDYPNNLSIALGTMSVTPINIASAYAAFANGGFIREPVFVRYINDKDGYIIEKTTDSKTQVISSNTAKDITDMLKEVVTSGTGQNARIEGMSLAGKTGTTDDYRDAWFAGYSENLTVVVWAGMDDGSTIGDNATGATIAAPIWKTFMQELSRLR
ncbi:MAG: PBP1A family penicillin-binding protein [Nitrospirae bacterium]|nr:PBP1A family penicillin-binding protein [Nitrospirota bacterium]